MYNNNNEEEYLQRLKVYEESIPYEQFLSIRNFLHDADIKIRRTEKDVIIYVNTWDNDRKKIIKFDIVFKDSKIISINSVKKNGHISRVNRKYLPLQYGYEEFYVNNEKQYISIIVFGEKIKKGIYYPFITIEFKNIEIVK